MKSLSCILFFILSLNATAQVTFGLRGGLNLNFMSAKAEGVSSSPTDYKLGKGAGGFAGGFVKIPFTTDFAFKPGVNFQARGNCGQKLERVNLFYSDIAPLFEYTIAENFFIEAGPVVSTLIMARAYSLPSLKKVDVTESVERMAIGLQGGVGYKINPKLGVTASIYSSLTKAWDLTFRDENNRPDGTVSYFPGNLSVGVEYSFTR